MAETQGLARQAEQETEPVALGRLVEVGLCLLEVFGRQARLQPRRLLDHTRPPQALIILALVVVEASVNRGSMAAAAEMTVVDSPAVAVRVLAQTAS
jgi:hypothetical protein